VQCDIVTLSNKKTGSIELSDDVFGQNVRPDLMTRVVNWQLAKRRSGNHKVKQRSEVTGSTAKPFNQKGGGRARQGDKKAPHMRGGGTAFGPVVRSHEHNLPKKVRKLALKSALSEKKAAGHLIIVDEIKLKTAKTSDLVSQLSGFDWGRALIIYADSIDENFFKASRKLKQLDLIPVPGANVYDILLRDTIVITKAGIEKLEERLK